MFCQHCGSAIEEGKTCPCIHDQIQQEVPHTPMHAPPGFADNDFVKSVTARFSINQLVVLGGCALLFIFLFLPFVVVSFRGLNVAERTSGFALIFGDAGNFGNFLTLLLPIIAVACLSVIKLTDGKMLALGVAFMGAYISFAGLFGASAVMTSVGVGRVLSFIMWLIVTAAAYMEYKGIDILNDLTKR